MTRRIFLAAAGGAVLNGSVPRSRMGITETALHPTKDTLQFLEFAHGLGAGGIQARLTSPDRGYIRNLRARAEQLGMYLELMASLNNFAEIAPAAKEAGAIVVRVVAPGTRRYEGYSTWEQWRAADAKAREALRRAVPVAEHNRIPLGLENHRDRTLEEFAALMKEYESEYFGAVLDTGNNIALLDDPAVTIETLAPYAVATHIKDMGVKEYPDGFLLTELPLGEGMVDLKRAVQTVHKARPNTRFTLEMITRNPTPVPCLTEKYWATQPSRPGGDLARMLRMVRSSQSRMHSMEGLSRAGQARLEEQHISQSLFYAREKLGL